MGRFKAFALVALLASASACTHDRGPITPFNNTGLYSANQPVVQRTDYVMDVGTSGNGLAASERARLAHWLEVLRLSYGDRVFVEYPGGYPEDASRQEVAALAAEYGLLLSDGAPVTAGNVQTGSVRVIVSRTRASVPGCPIWEDEPLNTPEKTGTNYGCATNSNLASMIADPNDLVLGQSDTEGTRASEAKKTVEVFNNRIPSGFKVKSEGK